MSTSDLLERALAKSGLTAKAFAETLMVRDERTIRRWRRGEPMPPLVETWLIRYLRE